MRQVFTSRKFSSQIQLDRKSPKWHHWRCQFQIPLFREARRFQAARMRSSLKFAKPGWPGLDKRSRRKDQFMKTRNIYSSQGGFTVVELLVALALIVLLMSILSQSFSEGARAFNHLKEIGDLDEQLGGDCMALAGNIAVVNQRTREFIENGLRTGTVNHEEASALREQYEAICAEALDLEVRLREVQSQIHNPGAQRVLQRSLNELERLKSATATMVRLLRLL